MSKIIHYYRKITEPPTALLSSLRTELTNHGYTHVSEHLTQIEVEYCYNVLLLPAVTLTAEQTKRLEWLLAETFEPRLLQKQSHFSVKNDEDTEKTMIIEYGPRMTFTSAFSSNATSICQACDIPVTRLELSKRYQLHLCTASSTPTTTSSTTIVDESTKLLKDSVLKIIHSTLHDRMTQQVYDTPLVSFDSGVDKAQPTKIIPIMEQGRVALEQINQEMGLGFDNFDLNYYTELFKVQLSRFVVF